MTRRMIYGAIGLVLSGAGLAWKLMPDDIRDERGIALTLFGLGFCSSRSFFRPTMGKQRRERSERVSVESPFDCQHRSQFR